MRTVRVWGEVVCYCACWQALALETLWYVPWLPHVHAAFGRRTAAQRPVTQRSCWLAPRTSVMRWLAINTVTCVTPPLLQDCEINTPKMKERGHAAKMVHGGRR